MNDKKYLLLSLMLFAAAVSLVLVRSAVRRDPVPVEETPLMIDIDNASAEELCRLPGIGPKTAGDIISYRNRHGGFTSIEDLMNIPGIKEKRFEAIKEFIYVENND